jgi:hypothetical protein
MGSVGKETRDTLGPEAGSSMDKLMLDIVVIVVLTEDVVTEVGMFEKVAVSWVTAASWFELVEFVSGIRGVSNQSGKVERSQVD